VRRTAFGGQGLGMSGRDLDRTLTNDKFIEFQQKITPKNMIISMSNIEHPEQLIQKITSTIAVKYPKCTCNHNPVLRRSPAPQPTSTYVGGLGIYDTSDVNFEFGMAFPAASSKSPHMELFNILRVMMGSASSFSSGGPGKGMHSRCTRNLLNQVESVEKASFINEHYDQCGLFGLAIGGPAKEVDVG
jgi:processing peptidase subunit alpha